MASASERAAVHGGSASSASGSASVALVTGGVRGIGLAVARALSARGDRVHIVYRTSAGEAAALAEEFAGRVHRTDVTREDELASLAAGVMERDGRIDHVVHCVGPFAAGPLLETDAAVFRGLFEHNTTSAFLLARTMAPLLRSSGGSFLFFGCAGLAGLRGRREAAAYAAAKSALLVLVRSIALEEGPRGVRANMLSPGIIPHEHADDATRDPARLSAIPMGRPGTPQDVAGAACFLTSPAAAHITGADLEVAGGWML